MTDREIVRRALFDAIEWQLSLADAYGDPEEPEAKRALALVRRYRAILGKRYGSDLTPIEELVNGMESVSIEEISRRAREKDETE